MAWRITDSLVRAVLDNRTRNRVLGTLWVVGREEPVSLDLKGNFLRDIAGCQVELVNERPQPGDALPDFSTQTGECGEMTASRRVRVLDVAADEALRLRVEGKPVPEHWGNAVYFEWFSEADGRIVIESTAYRISISEPAWALEISSEEAIKAQNRALRDAWGSEVSASLEKITRHLDEPMGGDEDDDGLEPEEMDEFEWERSLREAEARAERFAQLMKKYENEPDREELVAREMGWNLEDDDGDEDDDEGEPDWDLLDPELPGEGFEMLDDGGPQPDPMREGIDWIRNAQNRIVHPVAERAHQLGLDFWVMCDEAKLLGEHGPPSVADLVRQLQNLSAKLSGALNPIAYDLWLEGNFVVALLKRCQLVFNEAMSAMERVEKDGTVRIPPEQLNPYRTRLYQLREEMLDLMRRYRT